jgi:stage II sporulation protein R
LPRKARSFVVLMSLVIAVFMVSKSYTPALAISPAGRDLIRLHIIAHSDHAYDQALKLKVRDAVIAETAHLFEQVATEQEAQQLLGTHLEEVEQVCNRVLAQANAPYRGQAQIGIYSFPERAYEEITLPAGHYRALKIVLGDGQGRNWWCVLFPPLCFVSGSSGQQATPVNEIPPGMNEEVQRVMATGKIHLPERETAAEKVEVRFKVAEVWEKVRPRAQALLSRK